MDQFHEAQGRVKKKNSGKCSVPKYLRISRKHAHAEFFQQTTPHYLRESPHNSAKVTKIIDTSANKGEDRLTTMGDLAESASSSNGPKAQPGGFLMFQTLDYE